MQPSVTIIGCVYDKDGAQPDPKKVRAVHSMPPSESPTQFQEFLGMVTYLSTIMPSLFSFQHPLRIAEKEQRVHLEQVLLRSF